MIGKQKHKPVERYELQQTKKKSKKATAVAEINKCQYVNALQEVPITALTTNENP